MAVSSATLGGIRCFPVRFPASTSREYLPSLSSVRFPNRSPPSFDSKFKGASCDSLGFALLGYYLPTNPKRLQRSSLAAVVGDTTAVPNGCTEEQMSYSNVSDPSSNGGDLTSNNDERDGEDDVEAPDGHKMARVCDKLIEVFMVDKPTTRDWRRLLGFSKDWNKIRPHFYKRCQDRADSEDDPGMKHKLLRLGRKLKECLYKGNYMKMLLLLRAPDEWTTILTLFSMDPLVNGVTSLMLRNFQAIVLRLVDEDVQRHSELLEVIKGAPSEINEIVARRRKDFTKEFFEHLYTVAASYDDNTTEQNDMKNLGKSCLDAVRAYDTASESIEALNVAELKLQDIVNSPTLDAACRKIDNLAEKNQLDSTLMLMITKAWSAAKESHMVKDEAKDIMYYLYMNAREHMQKNLPKEVRILKYLLTVEDTDKLLCDLKDAFTPGGELVENSDFVYTTPKKLHALMTLVIDAYNTSREGTIMREARDLMNPNVIQRMEVLKKIVENKFM
ncbi:hypothetical protein Acr_21g0006000 [Actinidia rufa]|uniref:Uncharacterized protein n=1 Tax=Actinidia rufa TaxID=165716 RepID=A0A7J0GH04_9ERIC|nr:hypothetical protein Acr_21g0006000 [Actinidia rufa]